MNIYARYKKALQTTVMGSGENQMFDSRKKCPLPGICALLDSVLNRVDQIIKIGNTRIGIERSAHKVILRSVCKVKKQCNT